MWLDLQCSSDALSKESYYTVAVHPSGRALRDGFVRHRSIVRAMVRLDETCREFRDAARVMGNTALFQQMVEAQIAIKRDIIFAASLYVA